MWSFKGVEAAERASVCLGRRFLEDVVAHNLEALFPGMSIQEYHIFRVTRDADLPVREDEADDLLLAIQQELRKRRFGGSVVRLQILTSMSDFVRQTLIRGMKLTEKDVYEMPGAMALKDLMFFTSLPLSHLKDPVWTAAIPKRLQGLEEFNDEDSSLDKKKMTFFRLSSRKICWFTIRMNPSLHLWSNL